MVIRTLQKLVLLFTRPPKKQRMANVVYFICLWGKTPRSWLSTKPYPGGTKIGSVKWRGQPVTVKIVSGTPVQLKVERETYPPDLYALLKSNLQKQVRRGKDIAVATAARLWDLGQFELLRRLIVIAAEDAEVSTETVTITWLMTAKSKGLQLSDDHRNWVLGYIQSLVEHPVCRRLEIKPTIDQYNEKLELTEVLDSDHFQSEQIAGILFRTAYGGLKGDPPMISRCLDWLIQSDTPLTTLGVKRWTIGVPKLLINRAAIDHHIWSSLVEELQDLHPEYSQDFICTVIWECSSGYNVRKKLHSEPEWKACWEIIKSDFEELTKGYLSRILNKFNGL
jgi:hypothetical protein